MLFVGTSIIHPSTEGVFLLCNILDLLIYSSYLKCQYNKTEILEQVLPNSFGTSITDLKGYLSGKRGMRQGKELNGPWRMMYSLEIIRKENIYFRKDLRVGEDTIFTNKYLIFLYAKRRNKLIRN